MFLNYSKILTTINNTNNIWLINCCFNNLKPKNIYNNNIKGIRAHYADALKPSLF